MSSPILGAPLQLVEEDWRRWRGMKVSLHLCLNISYLAHVSPGTRMWKLSCLEAKRIHGNVNFCSDAKLIFYSILELHSLLADNLLYMIAVTHYSQLSAQKSSSFSSHSSRRWSVCDRRQEGWRLRWQKWPQSLFLFTVYLTLFVNYSNR